MTVVALLKKNISFYSWLFFGLLVDAGIMNPADYIECVKDNFNSVESCYQLIINRMTDILRFKTPTLD